MKQILLPLLALAFVHVTHAQEASEPWLCQQVSRIDRMIANLLPGCGTSERPENGTSIRLIPHVEVHAKDGVSFDFQYDLKLDMPLAKRGLRVLLQNNRDEDMSADREQARNLRDAGIENRGDDFLGVGETDDAPGFSYDFALGASLGSSPYLQGAVTLKQQMSFRGWNHALSQAFRANTRWDWLGRLQLRHQRDFSSTCSLSIVHGAVWNSEERDWSFGHHAKFQRQLSRRCGLQLGAGLEWNPERIELATAHARFSRQVSDSCLTVFMQAGADLRPDTDYDPAPFTRIGVEIVLGQRG